MKALRLQDRSFAVVRLVHPFPAALVVALSVGLTLIAHGGNPGWGFLGRTAGVIALSQIAVGALNEWRDREADAIGQPGKPIPSGLVAPSFVLALVLVSLGLLVPLALSFGPASLALALLGTSGGLAYDLWLKPTPASIIGYLVGFLSLVTWVWLIAGNFTAWFLLVIPGGTLLLVSAHLAQSFPDLESDRELGLRGLAVLLGPLLSYRLIMTPYVFVLGGAVALSLVGHSWVALLLTLISLLFGVLALIAVPLYPSGRAERLRLFHLMGPAIGVLGAACLLAVQGLP